MTFPEFHRLCEHTDVIVSKENDRKAERKRSLPLGHRKEFRVLHDEAHVPDTHESEPHGARKEHKVTVGPRLQLFNVYKQVDHDHYKVHAVGHLTDALAMIPCVCRIT